MTRPLAFVLAAALFALVATANSGGYRFGTSDQAFYEAAIAMTANPALFPRDGALLHAQMRWWLGDSVFGGLSRLTGGDMPTLFAAVYLATLVALFAGGVVLARALGADWWTVAAFVVLLTLRHRIAKTGANSLEGYMQPRMLAFAFGLASMAGIARGRFGASAAWTIAAALIHTTTAFWFGVLLIGARIWTHPRRHDLLLVLAGIGVIALAAVVVGPVAGHVTMIDPAWRAILDEKDYLYSARWPAYAWATNLAYPVVVLAVYRRRHRLGVAAPGEGALVAGLMMLVVGFLISVPLTEGGYAFAVQAQVNRIFWLLDALATIYLAWWVFGDLARRWPERTRTVLVAGLFAVALARGHYVLAVEAKRPLVELRLPADAWNDAMAWLRRQPASWHVLADPQHAWKYGVSVRVAAERDVLLEAGKDSAIAIYDRGVAMQVIERGHALENFDNFTVRDVQVLARRYHLDVFVDHADRTFALPVLYRNAEFIVYDLR